MNPKISVVMAVYNQERFLREAIASILAQTYKNFEFIIIDDGSTDNTRKIISSFGDKRIKVLRNKKNIGLTKSLNLGLKISRGEFIARMDADDISYPGRFELQVQTLQKTKDLFLIGSQADLIREDGAKVGVSKMPTKDYEINKVVMRFNPFIHPTLFFRRALLEEIGSYNDNLPYAQDYDLVLRALGKFKCANLIKPLVAVRRSLRSISIAKHRMQQLTAVKVRWHAIFNYHYPWYNLVFLIKPFISALIPISWKKRFYPL